MSYPPYNLDCPGYCFGCIEKCKIKERNLKQVSLSKLFHPDNKTNHLTIWQVAPMQPYYVKCPKTGKDEMVARNCVGCDGLRTFSYEKRYLDCRGKAG